MVSSRTTGTQTLIHVYLCETMRMVVPGLRLLADLRRGTLTSTGGTVSVVPTERGRWTAFYTAMAAAVRTGSQTDAPVQPSSVLLVSRVMAAARRSAAEKSVVSLSFQEPSLEQAPADSRS